MKKIVMLFVIMLMVTGCSSTDGNANHVSDSSVDVSVEDHIEPELVEMTSLDMDILNDVISTYFIIDSTLEDSPVKYKIEKSGETTNVIFMFENADIKEEFNYGLLSALSGALSVSELSVEYDSVIAELYDNNGDLIERKDLNK